MEDIIMEHINEILEDEEWDIADFDNEFDKIFDKAFPACAISAKDYCDVRDECRRRFQNV